MLADAVTRLDDGDLYQPSRLPEWTRAHLIGHLARNAEALGRLAAWARSGVETPMYASADQRAAEIDAAVALPPAQLRKEVFDTAADLEEAMDRLGPDTWPSVVRTAQGRVVPALELPWMRVREVWLHAVDLDAGVEIAEWPADLVDLLAADVMDTLSTRKDCPGVEIQLRDRPGSWQLGRRHDVTVKGRASDVLGWLSGRTSGKVLTPLKGGLPALPRWI